MQGRFGALADGSSEATPMLGVAIVSVLGNFIFTYSNWVLIYTI